jgi:hypothetical protein
MPDAHRGEQFRDPGLNTFMKIADITQWFSRTPDPSTAKFEPHLQVETERQIPNPIFLAGMIGVRALRCVPVPDVVWTSHEAKRDALVKAAIKKHYERCDGIVPSFGRITGYVLVAKPGKNSDFGLPFDVHGDRAGPIRTVYKLGSATLSVDGEILRQSIWSEYGRDRGE